jgi:hypothetical protein
LKPGYIPDFIKDAKYFLILTMNSMRFLIFLFSLLASVFFHSSCKKYQPAPDAFFMLADPVMVSTTANQGSGSHKITDLYYYLNGKFQGVYPIGNTIPVANRNEQARIEIFAGIKNSGIKEKSTTWMLYSKLTIDTLVPAGSTIRRPLTFTYNPNIKILWIEDFDSQIGYSLIKHPNSDTTYKIASPQNSFEGQSAEWALTGDGNKTGMLQSSVSHTVPIGNPNLYLELNYKAETEFAVGLTDGINEKFALVINPQANWNKIYIQLAEAASSPPIAANNAYRVFFKLTKPNSMASARVWLDNIKLVYL